MVVTQLPVRRVSAAAARCITACKCCRGSWHLWAAASSPLAAGAPGVALPGGLPYSLPLTDRPARKPQSSIPFRLGCGLLYVSHQLGNWQRTRLAFGGAPPRGSGVVTAAANPPPGLGPFGTNKYSALGQGYNVITGLPLSIGMSSLDPGFT